METMNSKKSSRLLLRKDIFSKSNKKIYIVCICFAVAQMLYIFLQKPYIIVGDEKLYKQLAMEIFMGKPVSTFHYPILYPALLSAGLFFKEHFLESMLLINIVFKTCSLFIIYRLIIPICGESKAIKCIIIISVTPIYFIYSRMLLAENIAAPLLIINVLYHVNYRARILNQESMKNQIMYTVCGALLSLSLFWSKYLMLVLLPVFCLYWCGIHLVKVTDKKKYWYFVRDGGIYTATVLLCLMMYALFYALHAKCDFSFELIKDTMGFSIGTGPESVGYVLMPEIKWVICYLLYAVMDLSLIIVGIVCTVRKSIEPRYKGMAIFFISIFGALVYIAARHSTLAPYNEGGLMVKLLGRYVAYATPLGAIIWIGYGDLQKGAKYCKRNLTAVVVGILTICIPYLVLYKNILWKPENNWLGGCRGLENICFQERGYIACILLSICVVIIAISKEKVAIAAVCISMILNSICAMSSFEKNNYMMRYAKIMDGFLQNHKNTQVSLLCNESLNYVEGMQMTSFYQIADNYFDVWTMPVVYTGTPILLDENRESYFMLYSNEISEESWESRAVYEGSLKDDAVFLNWDQSSFQEEDIEMKAEYENGNEISIAYEGNRNTILIYNGMIWPAESNGDMMYANIDLSLESDTDTIQIELYDLSQMVTSGEIVISR